MRGSCGIHAGFLRVHAGFMRCFMRGSCGDSCRVHAGFMWDSCGIRAGFMQVSCGIHAVFLRGSCRIHAAFMRDLRVHAAFMRDSLGMDVGIQTEFRVVLGPSELSWDHLDRFCGHLGLFRNHLVTSRAILGAWAHHMAWMHCVDHCGGGPSHACMRGWPFVGHTSATACLLCETGESMLIIGSQRFGSWFSHRPYRVTLIHLEPRSAQVHACYAILGCVASFVQDACPPCRLNTML